MLFVLFWNVDPLISWAAMAWVYEDKYVNVEWENMEIQTLVQELPYVERAQKKPVETYKAFPQRDLSRVFYR